MKKLDLSKFENLFMYLRRAGYTTVSLQKIAHKPKFFTPDSNYYAWLYPGKGAFEGLTATGRFGKGILWGTVNADIEDSGDG